MSAQVAAAKTAADHEAIADEYAKQAAAAEADAAMHDKMAASYKGLGKMGAYHGDQHCRTIATRDRAQAKELNELAAAHRAKAKALAK
jgi:cation diffusion facilitator CzcD-associated flavoprotein CzcO